MISTHQLDLRFVAERNIGSWLIRWYGAEEFSHVGVIRNGTREFGARYGKDGADAPGVQYRPLDYAKFTRTKLISVPVTEFEWTLFWKEADKLVGKPYSSRLIFGFAVEHDFDTATGFICSTLLGYLLKYLNLLPRELHKRIHLLTPEDIYLLVLGLRDGSMYRSVAIS